MNPKTYAYVKSRFFNTVLAILALAAFAVMLGLIADSADAALGQGTANRVIPSSEDIAAALYGFHPMSAVRRLLCTVSPYTALLAEMLWSVVKWIMNLG